MDDGPFVDNDDDTIDAVSSAGRLPHSYPPYYDHYGPSRRNRKGRHGPRRYHMDAQGYPEEEAMHFHSNELRLMDKKAKQSLEQLNKALSE